LSNQKIILGVDPGTLFLGYAIISIVNQKISPLAIGTVQLNKIKEQPEKLKKIFERLTQLIESYKPEAMAIEAPFFGKNVQSMLKLGRAQGVSIAAAVRYNLEVTEISPRKIKQSITGNGNASKEQVAAMLQNLLKIDLKEESLDATDALAVAVSLHFQSKLPKTDGKSTGWESFLKNNPNRLSK
jgi:crossover junction endodeoxyribonuclease RuvC